MKKETQIKILEKVEKANLARIKAIQDKIVKDDSIVINQDQEFVLLNLEN